MKSLSIRAAVLAVLATLAATFAAAPASAQATRTWVSGVGDDVNPCSRTAPCKTFAGAISKTAAGGEINCLDPGGFGAVTITKAMTISCPYTEGGALAGGNGITVNAAATDVVYIRGLDIFGVNPPSNGIRFLAGSALHIEDSVIRRFNAANSFGVSFVPSGNSRLFIRNTTIAENGSGATGGGVLVKPGVAGSARVQLDRVRIVNNANVGFMADTTGSTGSGIFVTLTESEFSSSGTHGIHLLVPAGAAGITAAINGNRVLNNATTGIRSDGAAATLRVGNTTIMGNGTGVNPLNGSNMRTYGDNRNDGNAGPDGAFTLPVIVKE